MDFAAEGYDAECACRAIARDASRPPYDIQPQCIYGAEKKVFEKVGGLEESYEQIFEESDLGWKIVEAGYTAWIATLAVTKHLGFLEPGCVPALRLLGIEKPYRTYCFARNRLRFARRHFSFLQVLSVALVFAPLSAVYYGFVALKNGRADIAWAYLKGTVRGILER